MRGESLRLLFRGRKGLVTDAVGFSKQRTAGLAGDQKGVEEARNTSRAVASAHGRGLPCGPCAGEETQLGFPSGEGDVPRTSPRHLSSELESAGWSEDTSAAEQSWVWVSERTESGEGLYLCRHPQGVVVRARVIPVRLSLVGTVHKLCAASQSGISSKLPAFPFPKEYKSRRQRWERETITAKFGELCALSWREVGTGDKALFVLEL